MVMVIVIVKKPLCLCASVYHLIKPCFRAAPYQGAQNVIVIVKKWDVGEMLVRCWRNTSPSSLPINTGVPDDLVRCWVFFIKAFDEGYRDILLQCQRDRWHSRETSRLRCLRPNHKSAYPPYYNKSPDAPLHNYTARQTEPLSNPPSSPFKLNIPIS